MPRTERSESQPTGDPPEPIWLPDPETIAKTHIAAALSDQKLDSYQQLYEWSVADPEAFWNYVLRALDIRFDEPPRCVLDLRNGPTAPDWLVGARMNIAESCFAADADAAALVEGRQDGSRRVLSYRQLRGLANRVARGLASHGIHKGQAVAVFMPMTAESVAIYLGIVLAGCTVVSIADSFSAEQVRSRLQIGHAVALFTVQEMRRGDKRLPVYDRVVKADGAMAIVLSGDSIEDTALREGDIRWSELLGDDASDTVQYVSPDTPLNVLFSSGTTGEPKAIVWDHTTPIKGASDGYFHHDIHPGDVVAWPTNLGWMMGPWLIFATLINRGTIALHDGSPGDASFGRFVQDAGVRMLGLVPSLVRLWRESGCLDSVDWSAVRTFSSTGECSNPDDMRWLSRMAGGKPIIEYCGGTEIGGGYITSTLVQPNLPATFSTPALGSALIILDEDGKHTDCGEVFLIPPAIGLSRSLLNRDHHEVYYAGTPLGPDDCILRRHGDQMELLPSGYYRALGRADDTMNLGGIKVGTAEIERAVADTAGVREVAAIAIAPQGGGPSQLVIFVGADTQTVASPAVLQQQMQQLIRSRLNPLFKIQEVVVLERLPRTASNKIMRRSLREHFARRS